MTNADGPSQGERKSVLRRAAAMESGVWRSLIHWARRRPIGVGKGDDTFGYTAAAAPVLWIFIALSAFEIPLLHFVLPWQTARLIFLLLGTWGLVWMVGFLASFYVHPHVVGDSGLHIRNSMMIDLPIPWDAVAAVRPHRRTLPKTRTVQFEEGTDGDGIAHITVSSMTNVEIELRRPVLVAVPQHGELPVMTVRCFADDPASLIAKAREYLNTPAAGSDHSL